MGGYISSDEDIDACTDFTPSNPDHTHQWQINYGGFHGEDERDE